MSERRHGGGGTRKTRVEHGLRDALTEMIAADIKDPRVHAPEMLTITRVELNVDMSVAHCYVSIVGSERIAEAAIAGLVKAAGFLRGPLGRRLGLQRAPELRFLTDPSIDVAEKLAAIVREDEERARAAGRVPGAEGTATEDAAPAEESASAEGGGEDAPATTTAQPPRTGGQP